MNPLTSIWIFTRDFQAKNTEEKPTDQQTKELPENQTNTIS